MVFTLKAETLGQDGKVIGIVTSVFESNDLHLTLDRVSDFLRGCGLQVGYLTDADEPATQTDNPAFDTPQPAGNANASPQ